MTRARARLRRSTMSSMKGSMGRGTTSRVGGHAHGAAHAGATETAVAPRVLAEILLMVVLGVIELGRGENLRGNPTESLRVQPFLIRIAGYFRGRSLCVAEIVDAGPVLGPNVVALPHPLGRIVILPEHFQQLLEPDLLRIEDDEHGLGVAGHARADFAISRIWCQTGRVADRCRIDAVELPELALRAPETAHREHRGFETRRERRDERVPVDEMLR